MFEVIRKHPRMLNFLLLLFIFPAFAFFGLSGYDRFFAGDTDVAVVAEQPISAQEFENARQIQLNNMRRVLGDQVDPEMFDTPQARLQILEGLIDQRVIAVTAQENRLTVSDDAVREAIAQIPGITDEDGAFDFENYRTLLASQGLSEAQFEASIRADLALQLVPQSVSETAFMPAKVSRQIALLNGQKRTVRVKSFLAQDYIENVEISESAGRAYYEENPGQFQSPEAAKINYLVLSESSLADGVEITDSEIEQYYENNKRLFGQTEERRASHILVEVNEGAPDSEKDAARQKAQALLDRIRGGEALADLAATESDDPGSASAGGDLGFFDKDTMTDAFADAAFSLGQGEVSDLVETEFGFHIIEVTEIRAESTKPFDDVKDEIETTVRAQKAREAYIDAADTFNNTVYEQPDSLGPTAEKLGLEIQTLDEYRRAGSPGIAPNSPLNNPRVTREVFNAESLTSGMNTEAIDLGNNTVVAVRVLEHRPSKLLPYEAVQAQAESIVRARQAAELAQQAGEAELKALQASGTAEGFGDEQEVSREQGGLAADVIEQVFAVKPSQVPTFIGVSGDRTAYQLVELLKIEDLADEELTASQEAAGNEQAALSGRQSFSAFLASLKQRTEIERFEDRIQGDAARAGDAPGGES